MEKPKVLSGEALVFKGITKIDASLPEVGLKDVTPNGSWLEQKQVQAALEARKYLIEVERIEKCGTLSHAEWHDNLMLAEVTQKTGGHWQYLGHNVGKTLYLRPEEALFLMEVNCLLLKHNDVTVSLQKAYSLLLRSSTTLIQYKVYASLSRLGYKVFKHKGPKVNNGKKSSCPKVYAANDYGNLDSPKLNTVKESVSVDALIVDMSNESENIDSPIVDTSNESENINLPLVHSANASANVDSPIVHTVTESANVDSPIVDIVTESENVESSIVNTVKDTETVDSSKESQPSKMSENDNQGEVKDSEDSHEISDDKVSNQSNENGDDQNGVTKERKSPIAMEVEELDESKTADNVVQSDTIQVPSDDTTTTDKNDENSNIVEDVTNKNVENNSTSGMEICTESQEATDFGVVPVVEEVNDIKIIDCETAMTEELSNVVYGPTGEAVNSGNKTIEDSTKYQVNNNDPSEFTTPDIIYNNNRTLQKTYNKNNNSEYNYLSKIDKLNKRQLKPTDSKLMDKHFENIPDLFKRQIVTVNVPQQQFIPKNIFVTNSNYLLNLRNIKRRSIRSASTESATYTSSDEVSGTNVRRIRSSSGTEFPHNPNFFPNLRFPRHLFFRPYPYWRPQNNLNFYQFNMFCQRPFANMFFQSRSQYPPRPNPFLRSFPYPDNLNPNNPNLGNNARKRMRSGRTAHLQSIKNLAVRLKQYVMTGNNDIQNLESLHSELHSYNMRYKSRLRLTENFDVVNEEKIVETIELDDDEETKCKKLKVDQDNSDKFDENLYRLRQLAFRLRDLETKDKATPVHRRAFSKAIKTFNKSYNADVYLNDDNYEVIDRRYITLESSSESDCVVEEQPKVRKTKGKRLRNPFNILKRRSERLESLNNPSTSKDDNPSDTIKTETDQGESDDDDKYSELIVETFSKTWLPNEKDFGRAEVVPKRFMNARLVDSNKEQYLYDYMKDQFQQHQNWLEAKISFLGHLEETNIAFQREQARILAASELSNIGLSPLLHFEDSVELPLVLEKLRIIKNNKEIDTETSLSIHFDVYKRDVQNFRKTNPPKPHFRMICLEESSSFPSAAQVMALYSKYDDNVPIVFAIVGIASISYLQINPIDLPVYVPSNDIV